MMANKNKTQQNRKELQDAFLEAFEELWTITHACRKVKIAKNTATRNWVEQNEDNYAQRYEDVKDAVGDMLEQEAILRGMGKKPVNKDFMAPSDVLLIFLLKGYKPEKYRETIGLKPEGEIILRVKYDDSP